MFCILKVIYHDDTLGLSSVFQHIVVINRQMGIEIPSGKYNKWCERRPLVCADEKRIFRSDPFVQRKDLTLSEKSAFYVHEIVACQGFEFVVFSNIRLDEPIQLPGDITLVPCFVAEEQQGQDSPPARLTLQMVQQSRFIYDGWLPIIDWEIRAVHEVISKIDESLSLFVLRLPAWFIWIPKYSPIVRGESHYYFKRKHIEDLARLRSFLSQLTSEDYKAFFRSVAWLSQSLRLTEPAARFLFSILAIESLSTYVQDESEDDSIFYSLRSDRLPKIKLKEQRQNCIRETMEQLLEIDPEKAVYQAYFECVMGVKKRLKKHLELVFEGDFNLVPLLFDIKVDGKTLYELRNDVAHGRFNALSEAQREYINARAQEVENVARVYILKVFERISGQKVQLEQIEGSISFPLQDGIFSSEDMYKGPINIAELYLSPAYNIRITAGRE